MLSAVGLVSDINLVSDVTNVANLVEVGSIVFYTAQGGAGGVQVWRSDGTTSGTFALTSLPPGPGGNNPSNLTNVGGVVYFSAWMEDGDYGIELWRSDGTLFGTRPVKDINLGMYGSYPQSLTNVGGVLYFSAAVGGSGRELWRSDGTHSGTYQVADVRPGASSSTPTSLTNAEGVLYFRADGGLTGAELWRSDGTPSGTYQVKDIRPGPNGSTPAALAAVDGALFFTANDGVHGTELWRSDGTSLGTYLVADVRPGAQSSTPASLTNSGGFLYFTANDGLNGGELWRSDGTTIGTNLVEDIRPGAVGSSSVLLTDADGLLYFSANDGVSGPELWRSDGTAPGTFLIEDLRPGASGSAVTSLTNVGGLLFFAADDGADGSELWRSNGTATGTYIVEDIRPGSFGANPVVLTNVAGVLYFGANNGVSGQMLWRSDGTPAGTEPVATRTSDSAPMYLTEVGGIAYFSANDGLNGAELWRSDGTPDGTYLLKDIRPGALGSSPRNLLNVAGVLFFTSNDGVAGEELWRSDGTPSGTHLVKDVLSGTGSSSPASLANIGGALYFRAFEIGTGSELWRSDGTNAGTYLLKNIRPSYGGSYPELLTNVGGVLYFSANDGTTGTELWQSDGTSEGTFLVEDIRLGANGSFPRDLVDLDGVAYFQANDGTTGVELWRSDGTVVGTTLLKNIRAGSTSSYPTDLTNASGLLYFRAHDGAHGYELWRTDGTLVGTYLILDIASGIDGSYPGTLTNAEGVLYFQAYDRIHGGELWRSDGTTAGTHLVKDIRPGDENSSSSPNSLTNVGGVLYFSANGGVGGVELWRSDGSTDGTYQVQDIRVGMNDSNPSNLTNIAGVLYLTADDDTSGLELWRQLVPVSDAGGPYSVETGSTIVLDGTASTDPTDPFESLLLEWDLDLDGQFGETGVGAGRGDELGSTPAFSALGLYSGTHAVFLRVTDPTGYRDIDSATIAVTPAANNLPPSAQAGGPYTVTAGASVVLDATATTDPNLPGDALLFEWDVDADGLFGETGAAATQGDEVGAMVSFVATGLVAQMWNVALRVTDAGGLSSEASAVVHILAPANNQPPSAEAGGPYAILPNGNVVLAGSGSDPNLPGDALVYEWDLDGDALFGESGSAATRGNEFGPTPTFVGAGILAAPTSVELRITDSGGLSAFDTAVVTVVPPTVLSVATSTGNPIVAGGTVGAAVDSIAVTFSREISTAGGANGSQSVLNPENWRLTRDGTDFLSRIEGIVYHADTHTAVAALAIPLTVGDVQLAVLGSIHDAGGLGLDGNNDGAAGDDFAISFTVALGGLEFRANTFVASDQAMTSTGLQSDGSYVVAWSSDGQDGSALGVYAQRYGLGGTPRGQEFQVNSTVLGTQQSPGVAVHDNGFVVVWTGAGVGDTLGIMARVYDSSGMAISEEVLVNATTSASQTDPAVAADANGGFVVVWSGNGIGDSSGIFARRYDPFGGAQTTEFRVNATTASTQSQPAIAMDDAGNFVVVWAGNGAGDNDGIFARVFNAAGVALTGELLVNDSTAFATSRPSVDVAANGDFVVAWQSTNQDGSGDGIQARRFTASGTAQGGAIAVNTTRAGSQSRPVAAREPDGEFLITWQSADASGEGIYAQWFLADGTPDGTEFLINTTTAGNQSAPAVAAIDGAAIVVWESAGQDGSGLGVYGQRLEHTDIAPPRAVGVTVGSTFSTHADYPVPLGSGEQLRTVPVALANQFQITFDSDVYVLASDLQVEGQQTPNYAIVEFSYDAPSRTATWTLAQPIGAERISLRLSDAVTTLTGEVLDGEWDNPTSLTDPSGSISGDGKYGGEFEFHLTSLPGDANRDNQVTGADYTIWADGFDGGTGAADAVFAEGDFNGDGHVTGADYTLWADRFGLDFMLPVAPPDSAVPTRARDTGSVVLSPHSEDRRVSLGQADARPTQGGLTASRVARRTPSTAPADEQITDWGQRRRRLGQLQLPVHRWRSG